MPIQSLFMNTVKLACCDSCRQVVSLEIAAPAGAPALRIFDCPHCNKTNFLVLDGPVKHAMPVEALRRLPSGAAARMRLAALPG